MNYLDIPRRRDALLAQQSFVYTVSGITPKCLQFYGFCLANVFCIVDGTCYVRRVRLRWHTRLRSRRSRTKTSLSINCFRRLQRVSADCRSLVRSARKCFFSPEQPSFSRDQYVAFVLSVTKQIFLVKTTARYTFSRAISSR